MTHPHIVNARKSVTRLEKALLTRRVDSFNAIKTDLNRMDTLIASHGPYPRFFQDLDQVVALTSQVNVANKRDLSARIKSNVSGMAARQRAHANQIDGLEEGILRRLDELAGS